MNELSYRVTNVNDESDRRDETRRDKTRQDERGDRRGYERRENSGDRMVGGIARERRAGRERRGREGS